MVFLQLFADTNQSYRHIFGTDTYNFPDFIVTQVLQPQHNNCPVKHAQPMDSLVEHLYLVHIFVGFIEQIDIHIQRDMPPRLFSFLSMEMQVFIVTR